MRKYFTLFLVLILIVGCVPSFGSAYDAKPKIVVVIVVDQLRGDLLERYHDEFTPGGFRLFMDHGAWFTNCYYNYANTKTAPGHATLGTGTYTLGHGIVANEFWDPERRRIVTSVEDDRQHSIGADVPEKCPAAPQTPGLTVGKVEQCSPSPHNLMTDTLADELKLATGGRSRTFGIALKDRAAILPVGFSANGAFWIEKDSGAWLTSTYYMTSAPQWLIDFNKSDAAKKYVDREWKDAAGNVLRSTAMTDASGKKLAYYDVVGVTPFGNDYTLDFARKLIEAEKLGTSSTTDLLSISFSSTDILGHKVGPDSPQQHQMLLDLDKSLQTFLEYLAQKVGRENIVLALSADHGIAPMPDTLPPLRIPGFNADPESYVTQLNAMIRSRFAAGAKAKAAKGSATQKNAAKAPEKMYVVQFDYPTTHLDKDAFAESGMNEAQAEQMVGEMLVQLGMRGYSTKSDLAAGRVANSVFAKQLLNAYSPEAGWYVISTMPPFTVGYATGTGHALPYAYDAHVPMAFVGAPFKAGYYDETVEPVDLAVTLSAVLGTNKPASAVGRVLSEALVRDAAHAQAPAENAGTKKAQ